MNKKGILFIYLGVGILFYLLQTFFVKNEIDLHLFFIYLWASLIHLMFIMIPKFNLKERIITLSFMGYFFVTTFLREFISSFYFLAISDKLVIIAALCIILYNYYKKGKVKK